ncbi:hypothetical protein V8E52_005848 [Russula decolorans]
MVTLGLVVVNSFVRPWPLVALPLDHGHQLDSSLAKPVKYADVSTTSQSPQKTPSDHTGHRHRKGTPADLEKNPPRHPKTEWGGGSGEWAEAAKVLLVRARARVHVRHLHSGSSGGTGAGCLGHVLRKV